MRARLPAIISLLYPWLASISRGALRETATDEFLNRIRKSTSYADVLEPTP